jgi:hypothetical protein
MLKKSIIIIWDVILAIDELHHFSRWLLHHQAEFVVLIQRSGFFCSAAPFFGTIPIGSQVAGSAQQIGYVMVVKC